jgi:MIP family channel proteins
MDQGPKKSYWAEFLGTFTLCFVGQGTIILQHQAGTNDLLTIAAAHGIALMVMVTALGASSGGHFNPAVTFGFWLTRRMSLTSANLYWVSQLLGAMAASFLLRAVMPGESGEAVHFGVPMLATGVSVGQGFLIEFVLTFFLVTAVWGTAVDDRAPRLGGLLIGLTVWMDILVGGPLTGAAMNPARAFGAACASGVWTSHWVYWAGPALGGAAAAYLYKKVLLPR